MKRDAEIAAIVPEALGMQIVRLAGRNVECFG